MEALLTPNAAVEHRRLQRVDVAIAAAIFVIALTLRLIYLSHAPDRDWPYSANYQGDAVEWVEYATALDEGRPFEFDLPLRSPAVGYVLHWLHPGGGVIHGPFWGFKALWCCISALMCGLAYVAFVRSAGRRVALIAAAMCVFSFGSYVTATSLNNEALYTFLLMAIVLGWQQLIRTPRIAIAIVVGALHGIATLVRQEHTLFMLMMVAVAAWEFWRPHSHISEAGGRKHISLHVAWSNICCLGLVLIASVLVCLPWSIHGHRAIQRFNTTTSDNPDYDHFQAQWTPEARGYIESMPAFARKGNASFIDGYVIAGGHRIVTAQEIDTFFKDVFGGYVPKPISPWVLVSMRGPLDFALANHKNAGGGFSKAALIRSNENDPALILGRPDHLRLVNEGYSIGFASITGDFSQWISNVGAKLSNFSDGITLGFTGANLPIGRGGVRRPVDVISAEPGDAIAWRAFVLMLTALGVGVAIARRIGAIWLTMIAYKIIVTIFFYGYARQAVSILPAFFFFQAVAIEQIGRWLRPAVRLPSRMLQAAGAAIIAILICIDVYASLHQPPMAADGPQRLAPQWGQDAFESVELVHLKPIP